MEWQLATDSHNQRKPIEIVKIKQNPKKFFKKKKKKKGKKEEEGKRKREFSNTHLTFTGGVIGIF